MPDKVFFDSNILIYAYSDDEPAKRQIVESLFDTHGTITISTQTINECIHVMKRKKRFDYRKITSIVDELSSVFTIETIKVETIRKAVNLAEQLQYSYFDSLIAASALMSNCSVLYTEDMHHEHIIEKSLKLVNPFA